jgi:hypothetical protein
MRHDNKIGNKIRIEEGAMHEATAQSPKGPNQCMNLTVRPVTVRAGHGPRQIAPQVMHTLGSDRIYSHQ